jgi:hypothetical protein
MTLTLESYFMVKLDFILFNLILFIVPRQLKLLYDGAIYSPHDIMYTVRSM